MVYDHATYVQPLVLGHYWAIINIFNNIITVLLFFIMKSKCPTVSEPADWHFHYNPEKFDSCVNNLRLISVQACNKKTFFLSKNTIFLGLSKKETCLLF